MMRMVEISRATKELAQLVNAVEMHGEIVFLCRQGNVVAKMVPEPPGLAHKREVDHFRSDPRLKVTSNDDPSLPINC